MVLWKSNLSISWKTQLFSTCVHGVIGMFYYWLHGPLVTQ
ncbi:hypothetical protein J4731_13110 [Providencia rettgeri]|nr:hypothetical protein [Providencia rettgeri]